LTGQATNKMEVILPDGDRSQYALSQPQKGLNIKHNMLDLLQSLKGH